ncbi:MAG: metallophosphoesterase [Lactobacillus sp.]|nr:metallophosphoesterase [Lactobacillus sp.]
MGFYIIGFVIALSCSVITIKTLVGYGDYRLITKLIVSAIILTGWFAPLWIGALRKYSQINGDLLSLLNTIGYFLFGAAFILFSVLIVRDIIWFASYGISKIFSSSGDFLALINPKNIVVLHWANLVVAAFVVLISLHAFYEGTKLPCIKEIEIKDAKITEEFNVVLVADLHISRISSASRVAEVVDKINALNADAIILAGDIIDDTFGMEKQLEELRKLSAKHGVFVSLGNHEVYRGYVPAMLAFSNMGFKVMMNKGEKIPDSNVFIAGVPDYGTQKYFPTLAINLDYALKGSEDGEYRLLISHSPKFFDEIENSRIDLQFSGHTHGGQIFPFHILAKRENKYLAGLYVKDDMKIYVSRGTGTWGPPMRLFAPSEITHIKLKPLD